MELCSVNHDEVCFETSDCPACLVKEEMQEKIDELREENDRLTIDLERTQELLDAEKPDGR